MLDGCLSMSAEERDRSHLIRQTIDKTLRQRDAAERLGLGLRQFKRLVRAWKRQGDAGLVHRQWDRASHNRLPDATRRRIEHLLRDTYPDFGPTLAAEKLASSGCAAQRGKIRGALVVEAEAAAVQFGADTAGMGRQHHDARAEQDGLVDRVRDEHHRAADRRP